ncbi:serine/threonine-protein kinase-like protein CCR4 [Prunus yedoensis var. nudiflora]|uniref:Serine/threonine-protein kinase-like protein CCR4 n=1 Tax=Prunus yedoensis var. nudiflora TaxID=2094558 RepID=A0A314YND5_PRUYE|nr:serine/threonine-protein kinase-like protein CCR4 [Prunus yedoensis var. nudiflora]
MSRKFIYRGPAVKQLVAGNSHVCGLVDGSTSRVECWQWHRFDSSTMNRHSYDFSSIAVGENFVCGVSKIGKVTCFGSNGKVVGKEPSWNCSAVSAGFNHACAISLENGSLHCWGDMKGEKPQEKFTSLALGENRSCALRTNGTVVCWGENNFSLPVALQDTYFVTIEAKRSVFCGVLSSNFSLYCWGNPIFDASNNFMVFESDVKPGPCTRKCPSWSNALPGYGRFCKQGYVCQPQLPEIEKASSSSGSKWSKKGGFSCSGFCKIRGSRIHDSGPLEVTQLQGHHSNQGTAAAAVVAGQPVLEKRLSHVVSMGANGASLEEFSLEELLEATSNFSEEHKIGTGSYGSVYYARLTDGRQVAIKRAETSASSSCVGGHARRQEDKDNAFVNELESLSRLNHKNLVRLLGFFEDTKERILVYEYMNNATLHDHLHNLPHSPLVSWAARINVALDAARGVEYLHMYAVPPVIHRDIKSSNILLDDTLRAKVSDFGLSLMGPEDDQSYLSLRAAGTFGYMDPEYYRLQQLTTKSDVYSFGVVLLELLSGYNAIHKNENGVPRNVVDFVVPYIVNDEIHRILDPKMPDPNPFEIEAVAYVGYLAADCVRLEGRDRPSMTDIVSSLERALNFCLASVSRSPSTTQSST